MQGSKPIPKFSSFRPELVATRAEQERDSDRHRDRHKHRDDHRRESSRHRHRRRSRSREHRSHDRRSRERHEKDRELKKHRGDSKDASSRPEEESDLFVIDRKGDEYNLIYGTIHRYNIPAYRRFGNGRVLGLPANYRIDRDYKDEGSVLVRTDTWRGDATRHNTRSLLSQTETKGNRIFRIRQDAVTQADDNDADKDFIPLESNGSRKRRRLLGEFSPHYESDSEAEKYGYRSIHGKAKPEQDIPSDLEVAPGDESDEDRAFVSWDCDLRQRNAELTRRTQNNPQDINAWIDLINFQDTLIAGPRDLHQLTGAEQRSLADIKLSLYEKALKNDFRAEKDRLLLGYMAEGAKLWDSKKLADTWHAILRDNPGLIQLWVKYLDYRQTEFLDFTFRHCRQVFVDCMRLNASSVGNREKESIHMYLFLRMTLFMREAGFTELAVGLWQAILEFTLFRPEGLKQTSPETVISAFVEFWDSEAARIGEPAAKGWQNKSSTHLDAKRSSSDHTRITPQALFETWMEIEVSRGRRARLPARSVDEVEDDDPYRVVLSSDFEDLLPYFLNWESVDVLVDSFLCFCHLPPVAALASPDFGRGDPFVRNELADLPDSMLIDLLSRRTEDFNPFNFTPMQNILNNVDALFASNKWFSALATWTALVSHDHSPLDVDWVLRCLRLLVDVRKDDSFAEYVLAVEFAIRGPEAKKFAKSLLKKRSSSLRLYNAYALMECRTGNTAAAAHVWATTLSMASEISDLQKLDYGLLLWTWVWELLGERRQVAALRLLLAISAYTVDLKSLEEASKDVTVNPTELLKSQRFLSDQAEHALTARDHEAFISWTGCLALLHYLAHSFDLTGAVQVFTRAAERLSSSVTMRPAAGFALELLHQARSRVIHYHVQERRMHRPAHIRELLGESITLYPHNTMFLSLFAWNEARFRIDDRVRDTLRDRVFAPHNSSSPHANKKGAPTPVTSHLFAIMHELHRPVHAGATQHSVRAAFERAIGSAGTDRTPAIVANSSSASSSLAIWKLYILHALSNPSSTTKEHQAKDVFYRAVRLCPWSKDILLLAFRYFQQQQQTATDDRSKRMNFWDLRRLYHVFIDKELRLHVELDEKMLDEAEIFAIRKEQQDQHLDPKMALRGKHPIELPHDADSDNEMHD